MPTIAEIADAVKDSLNQATFSPAFTAVRLYVPSFELTDMDTLHVSVVPRAARTTQLDRSRMTREVDVDVAVQQRFASDALTTIDPLLELAEEIAAYFAQPTQRQLGALAAVWLRTAHDPIYVPEHLDELRQLTSVVTLTFRVH